MRTSIRRWAFVAAVACTAVGGCDRAATAGRPSAGPQTMSTQDAKTVKIQFRTKDTVLTATVVDGPATRDFLALLPIDLELRDHGGTEKISDLPARLSTKGEPAGADPAVGDVAHYAPWGNLAIYYRDFGYSEGLVKLGRIESGLEHLTRGSGQIAVTVERISE